MGWARAGRHCLGCQPRRQQLSARACAHCPPTTTGRACDQTAPGRQSRNLLRVTHGVLAVDDAEMAAPKEGGCKFVFRLVCPGRTVVDREESTCVWAAGALVSLLLRCSVVCSVGPMSGPSGAGSATTPLSNSTSTPTSTPMSTGDALSREAFNLTTVKRGH